MPSLESSAFNSCDRNSAALSQRTVPTMVDGALARELITARMDAMNSCAFESDSDLFLSMYEILNRQ